MVPKAVRERYEKLIEEGQPPSASYYALEAPQIPDSAYDLLEQELLDIEGSIRSWREQARQRGA